eukprot:11986341-Ditylum_brightwellii.AAC.1
MVVILARQCERLRQHLIFVNVISKLPNPGRVVIVVCQLLQKTLMMWEDDDTAVRVTSIV